MGEKLSCPTQTQPKSTSVHTGIRRSRCAGERQPMGHHRRTVSATHHHQSQSPLPQISPHLRPPLIRPHTHNDRMMTRRRHEGILALAQQRDDDRVIILCHVYAKQNSTTSSTRKNSDGIEYMLEAPHRSSQPSSCSCLFLTNCTTQSSMRSRTQR